MYKPIILDLFCGAGGAAMGYFKSGFEVSGVDIKPQPRWPFPRKHYAFVQADALEFLEDYISSGRIQGFAAIHASPPCQAHTSLNKMWNAKNHESLIEQTRELLKRSGLPYIIENVERAPLLNPLTLCGSMFNLGTEIAELRRHRLFEIHGFSVPAPVCNHGKKSRVIGVYGGHGTDKRRKFNGQCFPTSDRRIAMGIDWMTGAELSQAIPPAYTQFIGSRLMDFLNQSEPTK